MSFRTLSAPLVACVLTIAATAVGAPAAQAKNGDTHITGQGVTQTLDCNDSTLIVNGAGNYVTAKGSCWAIAVQGTSNIIIADNVVHDIVVYGTDQTVIYHSGSPSVNDRGRELGMVNRIGQAPA